MAARRSLTLLELFNRNLHSLSIKQKMKIAPAIPPVSVSQLHIASRFYSNEKVAAQEKTAERGGDGAHAASPEIEALNKEISGLKEKNDEVMDKYKRALADGENMRQRLQKQINDAKIFGIQSFCKDLLEVADILGHATAAVPKEKLTDDNADLKNLYEGLSMTQASLLQVFKRHGVELINPMKEKFNPNYHEALFTKEDSSVEPNTIIEVTKLGYKLHERCIRPALVGVSKSG